VVVSAAILLVVAAVVLLVIRRSEPSPAERGSSVRAREAVPTQHDYSYGVAPSAPTVSPPARPAADPGAGADPQTDPGGERGSTDDGLVGKDPGAIGGAAKERDKDHPKRFW